MHVDGRRVSFASSRRARAALFDAHYTPAGDPFEPAAGTLEYFLTERYCLYSCSSASRAYRVEIQHRPWQLQPAEAEIRVNTMAKAAGIVPPSMAPLLHFARRQDVLTWRPHPLA